MTYETTTVHKAAVVGTGLAILVALYLTSLHSYLLFHSAIELFTIAVAFGVFAFTWNARRYLDNNYLLFVGIASFFIGVLDLVHTLAYEGIGVFGQHTSNLATQMWVAGRYLQALTMVAAPFFLGRTLRPYLTVVAFTIVTGILLATIFAWHVFPTAYVDGAGLTPFKKISEYAVSLAFLGAVGLLWWKREAFEPRVLHLLIASLALSIASELAFTSYVSVYGYANMVGHFFKLAAFYALYKAVIETGLVQPYAILLKGLKHSEDRLREYSTALEARNEDLRRTHHRLEQDAIILQKRNQELDAYAHTVAHDLKTPLSVLVGTTEIVESVGSLTPPMRDSLMARIRSTALEMNGIVDNLLLLSEVRQADAPTCSVAMGDIVRNARNRLQDMIRERHAQIVMPDAWPPAIGYAPWLEEVWVNYLSNALKYGGRPPLVELGASVLPDHMARFWVRDNGKGVPPATRDRMFIPFNELSRSRRTGHGLGLSIVLHIVEKLGGEVGVEHDEGGGSLFYFTLPTR